VTLLNGENEEIILREEKQLNFIAVAVKEAKNLGADGEDLTKLTQLNNALFSKISLPGTKAQLKPVYSKRQAGQVKRLTKLTLVFKWGGEVKRHPSWYFASPINVVVHTFCAVPISGSWRKHEEGYLHYERVHPSYSWLDINTRFRTDKDALKNVKVRSSVAKP
jgi:hypothetical protein